MCFQCDLKSEFEEAYRNAMAVGAPSFGSFHEMDLCDEARSDVLALISSGRKAEAAELLRRLTAGEIGGLYCTNCGLSVSELNALSDELVASGLSQALISCNPCHASVCTSYGYDIDAEIMSYVN